MALDEGSAVQSADAWDTCVDSSTDLTSGAARVQGAGADPGVLAVAPHQLLDARPPHALHEAALHLYITTVNI